jgi:hypothetical protein
MGKFAIIEIYFGLVMHFLYLYYKVLEIMEQFL